MRWDRSLVLSLLISIAASLGERVRASDFSAQFENIKTTATKTQLYTLLYASPKAGDLHHHAGGCWRMEDLFAVASDPKRNGGNRFFVRLRAGECEGEGNAWTKFASLAQFEWQKLDPCRQKEYAALDELTPSQRNEFINSLRLDVPGEGRDEFFEEIWTRLGAIGNSVDVFLEMTVETMKRYGAEGVRYLEPQMVPAGMTDPKGAMVDPDDFYLLLKTRLEQPDAKSTGVSVRWQVVVIRFKPDAEKKVEAAYDFVSRHRDLWVGINMAGREDNGKGYPRRFLEVYRKMRLKHSGIGLAIHAGEVDEPNAHMRDTLLLGATRLGHGNNILTDEDLLLHLRSGVAMVEINLVSNLLLEYVDHYSQHPFPELLRTGIPVALSTDDSGMWDSGMTDEYMTAVTEFNLTWDELVQCGRNSLKWSFAEPSLKEKMLADYDRDLKAFETRYAGKDWAEQLKQVKPVSYGFAKRRWKIEF